MSMVYPTPGRSISSRDTENFRVRGGGDGHHEVTQFRRRQLPLLVRWTARRHEHHLIEAELEQGFLSGDQMGQMDGIEGPSHDAQAQAGAARSDGRWGRPGPLVSSPLPARWPGSADVPFAGDHVLDRGQLL